MGKKKPGQTAVQALVAAAGTLTARRVIGIC
jgi:hypothetical protein